MNLKKAIEYLESFSDLCKIYSLTRAIKIVLVNLKKLQSQDKEISELKEKVKYVESMGLQFGIMKTSNKPEGFLAHVWSETSDYQRMSRDWMDSMHFEIENKKLHDRITELEFDTAHQKSKIDLLNKDIDGLIKDQEIEINNWVERNKKLSKQINNIKDIHKKEIEDIEEHTSQIAINESLELEINLKDIEIKKLRKALIETGCNNLFCQEVNRICGNCPARMNKKIKLFEDNL